MSIKKTWIWYPGALTSALSLICVVGVGCTPEYTGWGDPRPIEPDAGLVEEDIFEEPVETLAEWAESQEFFLAPWAHKIEGSLAASAQIELERVLFPREGNEEITEWRRNDVLWIQSSQPGQNILRRVSTVATDGDDLIVVTTPTGLDSLFLQVSIDTEASAEEVVLDQGESLIQRLCQVYPEDPVAGCETFPELHPDGYFIDPPPGRVDALVYEHRFEPKMRADLSRVRARLEVRLPYERNEKCACVARYYPNYEEIDRACGLGVDAGRVAREVDGIKGTCRGEVTRFDLDLGGDFELFLEDLFAESESGNFAYNGVLGAGMQRRITVPVDEGFLEVSYSIRTRLNASISEVMGLSFQHLARGPGMKVNTELSSSWPQSANLPRPRVSVSGGVDQGETILMGAPIFGLQPAVSYELSVDIQAMTSIWGVTGPSFVPLAVKAGVEAPFDSSGCPVSLTIGGEGRMTFPGGMPFATESEVESLYSLFDTCDPDAEGWYYCEHSERDPCSFE